MRSGCEEVGGDVSWRVFLTGCPDWESVFFGVGLQAVGCPKRPLL